MPHIPRYHDNLAEYAGDLRAFVFSSQNRLAKRLGVSHSTISRYENGRLTPPLDYFLFLADQVSKRLTALGDPADRHQAALLTDLNELIRIGYADQRPFANWAAVQQQLDPAPAHATTLIDWGDAPDTTPFLGRATELETLHHWIVTDRCRLVTLQGMGGMGKTMLAARLAQRCQPHFDQIVWRTLRNAPTLAELIRELTSAFSQQTAVSTAATVDQQLHDLHAHLTRHRCLLILDNLESIVDPHAASIPPDYQQLLQRLATVPHQSCLLLTSRLTPTALSPQQANRGPARLFELSGLDQQDVQLLLKPNQLTGTPTDWESLNAHYSGNPLALKLMADTVQQFFGGDVRRFLQSHSFIFGDIRHLLTQQVEQLPPLAQDLLFWLAVEREPCPIETLQQNLMPAPHGTHLIEALQTLRRRSLVEAQNGRFFLQNVIAEFATEQLVRQLTSELASQQIQLFQKIRLLKATAINPIRHAQERLFLHPLAQQLQHQLGQTATRQLLSQLLDQLKAPALPEQGYATGNLINLKRIMGLPFTGDAYDRLPIWHAYLQDTALHRVSFREADIRHAVFDTAFIGVNCIALSPDGTLLAVATGQDVRLWHTESNQLIQILQGHRALVWSLLFTQDGQTLYSSSEDGICHQWIVATGQRTRTLQQPGHRIWSMQLHAESGLLATGGSDGEILLWSTADLAPHARLEGHGGAVRALAFSPNGRFLAASGQDNQIILWELASHTRQQTFTGHTAAITTLCFLPHSQQLISGSRDHTVRIWDHTAVSDPVILRGHTSTVSAVTCLPDGQTIISGSYDCTIRIWDLSSQTERHRLYGHDQPIGSLDTAAAGQIVASGSYDRSVRLWDTRSGQLLNLFKGKTFQLLTLAFDPTNQQVASGGADYQLRVWDIPTRQPVATFSGHSRWISSVAFHPTQPLVASGSYDRTIRLWDVAQQRPFTTLSGDQFWVLSICFHPHGRWLAAGSSDRTVAIWDTASERLIHTLTGHPGGITRLAVNPTGHRLACGQDNGAVWVWDTVTWSPLTRLQLPYPVADLQFLADGQLWGMDVRHGWERWTADSYAPAATQTAVWEQPHPGALSPTGWIAGGGRSDQVWLAHLDHPTDRAAPFRLNSQLSCLHFSPDGTLLGGGCLNGAIYLWQTAVPQPVAVLQHERPYEKLDITDATGLTPSAIDMLKALGAVTHNDRTTP